MTFDAFAERVGRPGTTHIEERIHDPLVRIDNDLAVVWAPFDFLVTEKSTTAEQICSTSSARTENGSSPASPIPDIRIAQRSSPSQKHVVIS